MRHFPAFHDLQRQPCLVVGGGEAAARKLRLLLKAGARPLVVAPTLNGEIRGLAQEGVVEHRAREFEPADLQDVVLAFAATEDAECDGRVSQAARQAGVPVNAVDRPALSTFITPAIVERDPLVVAIGSGGAAPVLARRLRAQIESLLPSGLGRLAAFAEGLRATVAGALPDGAARLRFWNGFFEGPLAEAVLRGEEAFARRGVERQLAGPASAPAGEVALVGAGPGDPDLLTFKALRLMQAADAVVYDRLVAPEILDLVRRDAERHPVGKRRGHHSLRQEEINALLARLAGEGKRVVRLKGGDPFVFGRGGEEQAYLQARGIAVQIVPGITAAVGCAAAAGIPLTHRGLASAVTFLTGHGAAGEPDLDWAGLALGRQTLAVYMGLDIAGTLSQRLIEHGMAPRTPVAVIENGTRPEQRCLVGTLGELPALVRANEIAGPTLLIIGEVAAFAGGSARSEQHVILSAAKDLAQFGAPTERDPSLSLRMTVREEYAR